MNEMRKLQKQTKW